MCLLGGATFYCYKYKQNGKENAGGGMICRALLLPLQLPTELQASIG